MRLPKVELTVFEGHDDPERGRISKKSVRTKFRYCLRPVCLVFWLHFTSGQYRLWNRPFSQLLDLPDLDLDLKSGHTASRRLSLIDLYRTYLLTYLDPPILDRTMGSKSSPSAPVCSHSPDTVPIDSSVHQVRFKCGPPRLRWTTSSSATTTRGSWHGVIGWSSRWHPDNMACHRPLPVHQISFKLETLLWTYVWTDGRTDTEMGVTW